MYIYFTICLLVYYKPYLRLPKLNLFEAMTNWILSMSGCGFYGTELNFQQSTLNLFSSASLHKIIYFWQWNLHILLHSIYFEAYGNQVDVFVVQEVQVSR